MTPKSLISKYGKKLMTKIINTIIIKENCTDEEIRELLIEQNIIQPKSKQKLKVDCFRGYSTDFFTVINGRGTHLIDVELPHDQMKELISLL